MMDTSSLVAFAVSEAGEVYKRIWQDWELEFVERNIGHMPLAEIGDRLGRSENAVKICQVRQRIAAPSKKPGYYTGHGVAKLLRVDIHSVCEWHRRGILVFHILPGPRQIMRISRIRLWMFAINPEHWIYFKIERVRDPKLRRLIELRRERWGDEWWTTQQVADHYGLVSSNSVHAAIERGQIPAVRWGNWRVKRSDALAHRMYPGKGEGRRHCGFSTPRADAFLIKARDDWGLQYQVIAKMMKWKLKRVEYRYHRLKGTL